MDANPAAFHTEWPHSTPFNIFTVQNCPFKSSAKTHMKRWWHDNYLYQGKTPFSLSLPPSGSLSLSLSQSVSLSLSGLNHLALIPKKCVCVCVDEKMEIIIYVGRESYHLSAGFLWEGGGGKSTVDQSERTADCPPGDWASVWAGYSWEAPTHH